MSQPRATTAGEHGNATRPLHILIVEDHRDGRETLRALLELYGYQVETAADGLAGVLRAQDTHPDVAIIDIGLPGLNGFQVARRLRQLLGACVRLIAYTAYGDGETQRLAAEAGFDDFLVKPMEPERLLTALGHLDEG